MSDLLVFVLTAKLLCGISFCAVEEGESERAEWVSVTAQGQPMRKENLQIHFFHRGGSGGQENTWTAWHKSLSAVRRLRRAGWCSVPQKGMVELLSPFSHSVHRCGSLPDVLHSPCHQETAHTCRKPSVGQGQPSRLDSSRKSHCGGMSWLQQAR